MLDVKKIEKLSHLSFKVKKFLQFYPWKDCSPTINTTLLKEICESRVAIISSAGFVIDGKQNPFDLSMRFGDPSYRIISANTTSNQLKEYQKSDGFDHSGIKQDPFSAIPIQHLFDLNDEGFIGSVSDRHISLMGSTINTKELISATIPNIVSTLQSDKVDIAIFIPV